MCNFQCLVPKKLYALFEPQSCQLGMGLVLNIFLMFMRCASGIVVAYVVAIDVTGVRFPSGAYILFFAVAIHDKRTPSDVFFSFFLEVSNIDNEIIECLLCHSILPFCTHCCYFASKVVQFFFQLNHLS